MMVAKRARAPNRQGFIYSPLRLNKHEQIVPCAITRLAGNDLT